jgi:hypothetical protein
VLTDATKAEPEVSSFENSGMVYKTRQTALLTREKIKSDTVRIPPGVPGDVTSIVKILAGRKLFNDSRCSHLI